MERKIYWGAALIAVLILVATFFMESKPVEKSDLPWHVEHPTADTNRVFGITLGQSNTNDAVQRFREEGKPILFKSHSGQMAVEVFFEEVNLAGLKARIVLTIAVPNAELQGMFERGLRMNATGSGKEITIAPDDVARVFAMPISSLTYMPRVSLDDAVLSKRFGPPAQRIREKSGAVHWLYPQHGLDITLSGGEKPLLQYVAPRDWGRLTQPLLANGEILK